MPFLRTIFKELNIWKSSWYRKPQVLLKKPIFWVRELKQSNSEVDFLISHKQTVVPIEVKSGKTGTLCSLHSFIDISGCDLAVRLYRGKPNSIEAKTPKGSSFRLLNLPYFHASRIPDYLDSM
jgi:hypothetical protein